MITYRRGIALISGHVRMSNVQKTGTINTYCRLSATAVENMPDKHRCIKASCRSTAVFILPHFYLGRGVASQNGYFHYYLLQRFNVLKCHSMPLKENKQRVNCFTPLWLTWLWLPIIATDITTILCVQTMARARHPQNCTYKPCFRGQFRTIEAEVDNSEGSLPKTRYRGIQSVTEAYRPADRCFGIGGMSIKKSMRPRATGQTIAGVFKNTLISHVFGGNFER